MCDFSFFSNHILTLSSIIYWTDAHTNLIAFSFKELSFLVIAEITFFWNFWTFNNSNDDDDDDDDDDDSDNDNYDNYFAIIEQRSFLFGS